MRSFLAINFSEDFKSSLPPFEFFFENEKSTVVLRKNIHITIFFLGDISLDKQESLKNILKDFSFKKFNLSLGEPGVFRNGSKDICWFSLKEGFEELKLLHENLYSFAVKRNFDLPKQDFYPHITVARTKPGFSKEKLDAFLRTPVKDNLYEKVNSIDLMRSVLGQNGSKYEIIFTKELE